VRNPAGAATLRADLKRGLGIGNSSGVGMVAALIRWPAWLSAYNFPRELALAYAMSQAGSIDTDRADRVRDLIERTANYYDEQPDCPVPEIDRPARIAQGLRAITPELDALVRSARSENAHPWAKLSEIAGQAGGEVCEQVHAIIVEAFPEFAD